MQFVDDLDDTEAELVAATEFGRPDFDLDEEEEGTFSTLLGFCLWIFASFRYSMLYTPMTVMNQRLLFH